MSNEREKDALEKWGYLRYFLGSWEGRGTGQPGISQSERRYDLVLNDQFIKVIDRSVYPPQEKNPEGEIHEEIGFFSFDKARETFVLREFHVEGFVNQYLVERWDPENRILVLVTEAIENIGPGWQARTTYEIRNENEFRETFELAGPGKEWVCYITNEFERVQPK